MKVQDLVFIQDIKVRQSGEHSLIGTLPRDRGLSAGDVIRMYGIPGEPNLYVFEFPNSIEQPKVKVS